MMKRFVLICFVLSTLQAKLVTIVPFEFDPTTFVFDRDEEEYKKDVFGSSGISPHLEAFAKALIQNGDEVQARVRTDVGDEDVVIFENMSAGYDLDWIRELKPTTILIQWESPAYLPYLHSDKYAEPFDIVLTWRDDLCHETPSKFRKLHYDGCSPMDDGPDFGDRSFACMITGNKSSTAPGELYSARRAVVNFFEKHSLQPFPFHLYGPGWEKEHLECYLGSPKNRWEIYRKHKFAFSFENWEGDNGYITEKIFDAFRAGTIPVYFGAQNISSYIPEECYIDYRVFDSLDSLYAFLTTIREDEWKFYQDNIREFLSSEKAKVFTREKNSAVLLEVVSSL